MPLPQAPVMPSKAGIAAPTTAQPRKAPADMPPEKRAQGPGPAERALLESLAGLMARPAERASTLRELLSMKAKLRVIGPKAVEDLGRVLMEESGETAESRENIVLCIRLLGAVGDRRTGRLVNNWLFNNDPEAVAEAAQALAELRAKDQDQGGPGRA